jgi:hypothetical protein
MMNTQTSILSWIASHWRTSVLIAGAVGIAATCRWCLETAETRAQRTQRNRKKEVRALADKISSYGRNVHQRYPTGDVVVSEHDLAAPNTSRAGLSARQAAKSDSTASALIHAIVTVCTCLFAG